MLRLRPYEKSDAQAIVRWCADETAFRKWSADRFDRYPITADDLNAQYELATASGAFFPFTAVDESGVVGHLIMRYPEGEKDILRFGFVIVDSAKRGRGLGREMLNLAIRYAFTILKAEKITLGVFENNPAAYYCYRAAGFRDVPQKRPEYYHVMGEDWLCLELELPGEQE